MGGLLSRDGMRRARPGLLAAAFALLVAVLLATLLVLLQRSADARDRALARKQHSFNVVVLTAETDGALARAEAALGRYVTDGDAGTGMLYYDEWRRAGQTLDALAAMVADNPAQGDRAAALRQLYHVRGEELAKPATLASYRRGWAALSLYSKAGRSDTLPRMRRLLRAVADAERTLLDARSTLAAERVDRANQLTAWLAMLGILLTVAAIATGALAVHASTRQRAADAVADAETDRAQLLEAAVAARTLELSEANASLVREAATREEAEAKLRQVQKLEAIGQLTGGIAHDFNNMLAVVLGGIELAKRRVDEQAAEASRHLESAMDSATRAAALTRRLLTFARNEPLLPSAIDPARLLAGMADLIDRTIGERIEVRIAAPAGLWPVWVDPFQLENAILNLCVNARDAMAGAGVLRIEAANLVVAAGDIGELAAGDYLRVAVIDSGSGMSPEVLARVFEPFFTTKPVGQGTGLGLSQIFGFARESGGEVAIDSAPGAGTTVALYLPRHHGEVRRMAAAAAAPATAARTGAAVLVVEDDPRVRAATGEALAELGYRPLLAADGGEADALLAGEPEVALLISDVVMPHVTGPELVERLAASYPALPVLFVTGYVGEAGDAERFAGRPVLRKPFTIAQLGRAVAAALDDPAASQQRAAA